MHYGASYYPEHKNADELRHDIKLLIESGINTVRMGEFAWNRWEPEAGRFEFGWLDPVVDELGKHGIKTVICTPTACPPAWLFFKYDMAYVDNRGVKRPFGGRRHYCYNSQDYRRHCAQVTEAIARHYGNNPHVLGFQIDNEPAQEVTGRCCCPTCRKKFSAWLEAKYGDISEFNRRSGGIFWAQEYESFDQISPPVNAIEVGAQNAINAHHENPTVRMEFERFSSESQIEFQAVQSEVLKKYTDYPVTTNGTGLATNSIDYYRSFKDLDVYAFDFYPSLRDSRVDSFPYAFGRGVKGDGRFWVLEFMSGGGHRLGGSGRLQTNPGALKRATVHSFAHGGEMMLHFQFRTFPFGAEQLNYAIVDMDGVPRRRYYEMKETAELMRRLEPIGELKVCSQAAVCVDYDSLWAYKIKPANSPELGYLEHATCYYQKLMDMGVGTDVISPRADFSAYKLLVLPAAFVMTDETKAKVREFVQNGGTVLATFLTAVKNEDNVGYTDSLPSGLTDVFGITVQEVEPVFQSSKAEVCYKNGDGGTVSQDGLWSELLSGQAEIKAVYTQSYKEGEAVVSRNDFGKGFAWYVGTQLQGDAFSALMRDICGDAGIDASRNERAFDGIETLRRAGDGQEVLFVFNWKDDEKTISLDGSYQDYISKEPLEKSMTLAPQEFRILKKVF
ncbi:MAG: beta-galactosidase [Christensenellales bacterium]